MPISYAESAGFQYPLQLQRRIPSYPCTRRYIEYGFGFLEPRWSICQSQKTDQDMYLLEELRSETRGVDTSESDCRAELWDEQPNFNFVRGVEAECLSVIHFFDGFQFRLCCGLTVDWFVCHATSCVEKHQKLSHPTLTASPVCEALQYPDAYPNNYILVHIILQRTLSNFCSWLFQVQYTFPTLPSHPISCLFDSQRVVLFS